MIKPRAVRPGDRIAVVSPASPFHREELDLGIAELRRLGYEPVYDDSIFERAMFTSGPASIRAAAFMRAWKDPDVAALMAVRGGYGSVQLLPAFDAWPPEQAPKLFIGYSDNTSLLSWLTCQRGVTALHGPMLDRRLARGPDGYDRRSLVGLLQGEGAGLDFAPDGLVTIRRGEAAGLLFGGTLTQLVGSLGTPFAFDPPDDCVLFLEDVNERPYRIDRMLTQLGQSGIPARARALVFGEMRGCEGKEGATVLDVIREWTAGFAGPVLLGFPSGHTTGPCWTLPLGVRVRVRTSPRASLVVEESPVSLA
ncbi:MAG: LD-carboxypeptidase [Acidobacteria bacterium]|nr:LD-carboxypeptidase [Acidobacteriota bacterium]